MRSHKPYRAKHPRVRPELPISSQEQAARMQRPSQPQRPRGFWRGLGFLLGGPVAVFGTRTVLGGARAIEDLADTLKVGPGPDRRVRLDEAGAFDVNAMAFLAGTNPEGVEIMLANRRRQSARASKIYLAGGGLFLAFWFYEAFGSPGFASLPYVLGLIAFCAVFFLSAFHNALINWQIRTRRLGTAREFFNANETWWPS